jgi:hypothetical protein
VGHGVFRAVKTIQYQLTKEREANFSFPIEIGFFVAIG